MTIYNTEQRKALTEFLTLNADRSFTVDELADEMNRNGMPVTVPGKSTIYRLMTRLVDEGTVKRFVKGHSRQFLYQIAGGDDCHHHLHLKCMKCGILIHMDDKISDSIQREVRACADFTLDREETTLFGCCKQCISEKNGDNSKNGDKK